jgi:hypothetical protein
MTVSPQYVGLIIGFGGSQINKLNDDHDVYIEIGPRSESADVDITVTVVGERDRVSGCMDAMKLIVTPKVPTGKRPKASTKENKSP